MNGPPRAFGALLVLVTASACIGCTASNAVPCGDGSVCPAGYVCEAISQQCVLPGQAVCGNGVTEAPEQCDDGADNSNGRPDACRTDCRPARCGDGVEDAGEECDDRNTDGGDGCSAQCRLETCGNGFHDPLAGEECDDGNAMSRDGCSSDCLVEVPTWSPVGLAPTPPPRRGARVRYNRLHLERWLAGGVGANGQPLLDLWRFTNGAWIEVNAPEPGAFRDFVTPVLWSGTVREAGHPLCNGTGNQAGQWLVLTRGGTENAEGLAPLNVWAWQRQAPHWDRLADGPLVPLAPHDAVLDVDRGLLVVLFPEFSLLWDGTTWSEEASNLSVVAPSRIDATPSRCFTQASPVTPPVAFATESFVGWYDQGTATFVAPPNGATFPGAAFLFEDAPSFLFRDGEHDYAYQLEPDSSWRSQVLTKGAAQERPIVAEDFAAASNGRSMLFMFGGAKAGLLSDAFWVHDGGWVEVLGRRQPQARSQPASAFDPVAGEVVLFGGASPENIAVNTWQSGGQWLPGERDTIDGASKLLGFEASSGRLVLVDREDGTAWLRTGTQWFPIEPPPDVAPPESKLQLVVGPNGSLLAIGSDGTGPLSVAVLEDTSWAEWPAIDPPHGAVLLATTDIQARRVVLLVDDGLEKVTWSMGFDGAWLSHGPVPTDFPDEGGAMTFDPARRRTVHYGGTLTGGAPTAEMWEFDMVQWTVLNVTVPGPPMSHHALSYDSKRRQLVAIGSEFEGFTGWQLTWANEDVVLETCDNGVDDDGDGLADCSDPDCSLRWSCGPYGHCGAGGDACQDHLWCTDGTCIDGECEVIVEEGFCVIDDRCISAGTAAADDPACWCAPEVSQTAMSCHLSCGDGQVQAYEQCDDGGTADGDGCSSTCAVEHVCLVTVGAGGVFETLEVTPAGGLQSLGTVAPTVPLQATDTFPEPQRFAASGRRVLVANGTRLADLHLDWDGGTTLMAEPTTTMDATAIVAGNTAAEEFVVAGPRLVDGQPAPGTELKMWTTSLAGNLFVPPGYHVDYPEDGDVTGVWLDRMIADGVHDAFNGFLAGFAAARMFVGSETLSARQAAATLGIPSVAMGTGPLLLEGAVTSVRSGPSHRTLVTGASDGCLHGWLPFGSGPVWADTRLTLCDQGPAFVDSALAGTGEVIWVSRADGTVTRGALGESGLSLGDSVDVGVAPAWLRLLFDETVLLVIGEDGTLATLDAESLEVLTTLPGTLTTHKRQSVAVLPCLAP